MNLQLSQSLEEVFEQFSLLRNLTPSLKQKIFRHVKLIRVEKGARVCVEGQQDRKMFGVIKGRLGVYKQHLSGQRFIVDLHPGALFGEVSFFKGDRRTASVYAFEECELLQIEYVSGADAIELSDEFFRPLQDRIWLSQALVTSKLFQGMPLETMDQILLAGKILKLPRGSKLTTQGEPGDMFFLIIQGEAQVEIDSKFIRKLGRGDIVGELALTLHRPRSSTVTATQPMELLAIKKEDFWSLLANNWGLGLMVESASQSYVF